MRGRRTGLALVLACSLLSGACTSDPASDPSPAPGKKGRNGSDRPRGTIDFGVIGEPATLDPYSRLASDLTYALVRPVYPSLYRFGPDGTPEPELSATMSPFDGGVRIELENAVWSDGRPISARDVVASVRRARPPSGFAGLAATISDEDTVVLRGERNDWASALATVAFVLPRGRPAPKLSGGPLRMTRRVPGLRVVYQPNERWEADIDLARLRVDFVEDASSLRSLVASGELDGGWLPSSVNLEHRLDAAEIHLDSSLGWESIYLDLGMDGVENPARGTIAAAIDRAALAEGLIRSLGRVSDTLHPIPGPDGADGDSAPSGGNGGTIGAFSLAVPEGDELLGLLQRAIQLQLAERGVRVDLVSIDARTFYGPWQRRAPVEAGLVRRAGGPWWDPDRDVLDDGSRFPLFHVTSFIIGNGMSGYRVNPTFEGPLWNVDSWSLLDRA